MKPIIVIKTGGKVAVISQELTSLITEIKSLSNKFSFILVHGGGAEVTQMSDDYGIKAQFINGVRETTQKEMDIADCVLSGQVNTRLVREFQGLGVKAVGLSGNDGGLFTGESIDPKGINRTGKILNVESSLLKLLLENNYLPIVCSVSMDKNGCPLNINADEAALGISKGLCANRMIFISDIPGILKDNKIIGSITPVVVEEEISSGVISGGMIPKVRSSLNALENGVKEVIISNYETHGDLELLINNKKGSIISLGKE